MDLRRRTLAFACIVVGTLVPLAGGAFLPADLGASERDLFGLLGLQLVMVCIAVGTAAFLPAPVVRTLGCPLASPAGRLGWPRLALGAVGLLLVSKGLNELLIDFRVRDTGSLAEIDGMLRGARQHAVLLAVFAVGIGPGIAEELLFRGLVQRTLQLRLPAFAAVAVTAALFGLVHFDPVHSPIAFGLGLYLGAVGVLAGNVWAPMLCHVANNAAAAMNLVATVPAAASGGIGRSLGLIAGGALVLAGVAGWARRAQRGLQRPEQPADP